MSSAPKNLSTIELEKITETALMRLLNGNTLAISIPNYTDPTLCTSFSDKILSQEYEYYLYAEDSVGRYGMSFSEIGNLEENFSNYYEKSQKTIELIRNYFSPYLAPVDKLRLELQEIWSNGANIEELHARHKMFVGLLRVIDANKEIFPHQDVISWDAHHCPQASEITKQLAVNVYLQVPEEGGELELWDFGYTEKAQYEQLAEGSYGIQRSKLPPPALTLKPKVGEMIIFNPQNLHCIREGKSNRLTMSCFLGYRGIQHPLTYFS